jgi:hypothetical protein
MGRRYPTRASRVDGRARGTIDAETRGMSATTLSLVRWTAACSLGELLGFGVAGMLGALAFGAIPDPTTVPLAVALVLACAGAGLIEGALLGLFQWLALRSTFPSISARAWAGTTALAGATGWILGSLPPTLVSLLGGPPADASAAWDPGLLETIAVSGALGLVLGAMFGVFQWIVLRKHADHAHRWIGANALAWMVALPWSYVAGSSVPASSAPIVLALVAIGTGVSMGLTVALITGLFLRRLAPRSSLGGAHGLHDDARRLRARASVDVEACDPRGVPN